MILRAQIQSDNTNSLTQRAPTKTLAKHLRCHLHGTAFRLKRVIADTIRRTLANEFQKPILMANIAYAAAVSPSFLFPPSTNAMTLKPPTGGRGVHHAMLLFSFMASFARASATVFHFLSLHCSKSYDESFGEPSHLQESKHVFRSLLQKPPHPRAFMLICLSRVQDFHHGLIVSDHQ